MATEDERTRQWLLRRYRVNAPEEWLHACIEWLHEENQGLSGQDIFQQAMDQWLMSDLRDIGASCLPPELSTAQKYVLNGCFNLQINSIVDVGSPYYSQLLKVKGTENENASVSAATQITQAPWEAKPSRMLLLTLTDGEKEVQAMEYKHIPGLNTSTAPGTKVLVEGEVLCRRGMLMLTKDCVKLLGGEVDTLVEENTQQNLLGGALQSNETLLQVNRPECPRKQFTPKTLKTSEKRMSQSFAERGKTSQRGGRTQQGRGGGNASAAPPRGGNQRHHTAAADFSDEDDEIFASLDVPSLVPAARLCTAGGDMEDQWDDDDDDLLMSLPTDPPQQQQHRPKQQPLKQRLPPPFPQQQQQSRPQQQQRKASSSRDAWDEEDEYMMEVAEMERQRSSSSSSSHKAPVAPPPPPLDIDEDEYMMAMEAEIAAEQQHKQQQQQQQKKSLPSALDFDDDDDDFLEDIEAGIVQQPKQSKQKQQQQDPFSDDFEFVSSNTTAGHRTFPSSAQKKTSAQIFTTPLQNPSNPPKPRDNTTSSIFTSVKKNTVSQNTPTVSPFMPKPPMPEAPRQQGTLDTFLRGRTTNSSLSKIGLNTGRSSSSSVSTVSSTNFTKLMPKKEPCRSSIFPAATSSVKSESVERNEKNNTVREEASTFIKSEPVGGQRQSSNAAETSRGLKRSSAGEMKQVGLHTPPYTYLSVILKQKPTALAKQEFYIKAFISSILSKLSSNQGRGWALRVKINDGTAAIEAELADEMLSAMIGYTAKECEDMRAEMKTNKELGAKLKSSCVQAQSLLVAMNGVFTLEVPTDESSAPVIRAYTALEKSHLVVLKQRQNDA